MPPFCRSSTMQHITHSLAAAFLQDVWLDWLRHLQEHNAAQQRVCLLTGQNYDQKKKKIGLKYFIANWTSQNIQIFRLLGLIKILVVKTKENDQFVSKRSFMCRKRPSSWMMDISCPLLAVLNNCVKKRRGSGFLQIFAQKKISNESIKKSITDVNETPTCLLHWTASPNWEKHLINNLILLWQNKEHLLQQHQDPWSWGK